jgi:hypothetical protein
MALWCDLRLASNTAVFGCLERRFGVPLVDGGTVRLPRVVGVGVALEMILTGREMTADEAYVVGLVNGIVPEGTSLAKAVELAESIAMHPQQTVRSDRAALLGGLGLGDTEALELERRLGAAVMDVAAAGADRFAAGAGRSGAAIPQVFAATDSQAQEGSAPRSDPRLSPPPAGHGRPVIVVASEEEEGWRADVVRRLHDLGYVTYDVIASGTLEADIDALGRAVAAVLGSANVLGDTVGLLALGRGAPSALHFSTMDGRIGAVVEFSGHAPEFAPSFRLAGASYLGHHGAVGQEGEISPFQMESHLRDLGVDATFHSYRGAAPDFFVEGSPGHHPTFTDAAWQRTRLFLDRAI